MANIGRDFYFDPPDLVTELLEYIVEKQYRNQPKKLSGRLKKAEHPKIGTVELYLQRRYHYKNPDKWPKQGWRSYFIEVQKVGERWSILSWAGDIPEPGDYQPVKER